MIEKRKSQREETKKKERNVHVPLLLRDHLPLKTPKLIKDERK